MCFVLAAAVDAAHECSVEGLSSEVADDGLMRMNQFGTAYLNQFLLDFLDRIEGVVVLVAGLVAVVVEQLFRRALELVGEVVKLAPAVA